MQSIRKAWKRYKRWKLERGWGTRARTRIHEFGEVVLPYIRVVIPNFRAAHYVYIISWTFVGTFLVYPVHNIAYIDALFLTAGASTQAGLNTVDGNKLTLYQQIVVYIITSLTTPIFIHGSILFFRLYAFERHFDNIRESSKLNFKMRRSATLAARTKSFDSTLINTVNNQGLGMYGRSDAVTATNTNYNTTKKPDYVGNDYAEATINGNVDVDTPTGIDPSPPTSTSTQFEDGKTYHISEPSDSEPEVRIAPDARENVTGNVGGGTEDGGIRFGNLPQPSKRRQQEVNPSDMYMSISMLQKDHRKNHPNNNPHGASVAAGGDDDDGPVLVIRPPNEIENDKNPIFKTKPSKHSTKKWMRSGKRNKKKWSKLKKNFSNSPQNKPHITIDDYDSHGGDHDDEGREGDNEEDLIDDILDEDIADIDASDEGFSSDVSDIDDDEEIASPSHSRIRKPDDMNGDKHSVKSPTIEGQSERKNSGTFTKSPTFERLIKHRLSRRSGGGKSSSSSLGNRRRLSRYSSNALVTDEEEEDSFDSEGFDSDGDDNDSASSLNYTNTNQNRDTASLGRVMSTNYLSWVPTVGRNSTFVHLSDEQKQELGGVEYRAVKLLIKIIIIYYLGWHLVAVILLLPYILSRPFYEHALRAQGISPTWWAFFTAQSSFNDLGLTLTADSMQTFSRSTFVMIVVAFFVVIGNTGFPVFLRFLIWILFKCSKPLSLFKESLGFLLDHPRRCFTLLFPSIPTWWLFFILVILNAIDLVLFIILDLNNDYLKEIPIGYRILDGLFQAFSTRTAGFAVIDLSKLHPAVQVSYMLMMYISVLPLAISIRRTNVYEEQSLGVYLKGDLPGEKSMTNNGSRGSGDSESNASNADADENKSVDDDAEKNPTSFIGAHLRNQLSFDLWFIFLGLFIICIAEGGKLTNDPLNFSIFKVLFEIISAYGTVGLSLGFPGINASFSYEFSTLSKLVIVAMMIRGRHRGLPYSLDRAIMLPDDKMQKIDEMQEHHAVRRNNTRENHHSAFDDIPLKRVFTRRPSLGFDLKRKRTSFNSESRRPVFGRNNTMQDNVAGNSSTMNNSSTHRRRNSNNTINLGRNNNGERNNENLTYENHELTFLRPTTTT